MKNLLIVFIGLITSAAFAQNLNTTIPLSQDANTTLVISPSLTLKIAGDPRAFDVIVNATEQDAGCNQNRIHAAPHGPDQSQVMPWHVKDRYFPNTRNIPVCGTPFSVEISLLNPEIAGNDTEMKFTAGTLNVRVSRHTKKDPRRPRVKTNP
ncbi:MAG: hypothetical protein HYS18_11015 [Burkholderiales bacterium]|nr:hypothetical protein [Burkholderiales bacterium]